jgi:hypothetical protein
MDGIKIQSRVGPDGVLKLSLPLGPGEANADVVVTIQRLPTVDSQQVDKPWQQFLDETFGSCAGLGLERGSQGDYEQREAID